MFAIFIQVLALLFCCGRSSFAQDSVRVKFSFSPLAGGNHYNNWQLYPFPSAGYIVGGFFDKTKETPRRIATTDLAAKYMGNTIDGGSIKEIKRMVSGFTGNYRYSNNYLVCQQKTVQVYAGFAGAFDFIAHFSYDPYTSTLVFFPRAVFPLGGAAYFRYKRNNVLLHNSVDFYFAGAGLTPFYKDFRISPQNLLLLSPLNYRKLYNRLTVEVPVRIGRRYCNTVFVSYIYSHEYSTLRDNKLISIENNITVGTVFQLSKYFN